MIKYYANYKIYHEVKDGDICRKSIKGFDLSLSKPESTFMAFEYRSAWYFLQNRIYNLKNIKILKITVDKYRKI